LRDLTFAPNGDLGPVGLIATRAALQARHQARVALLDEIITHLMALRLQFVEESKNLGPGPAQQPVDETVSATPDVGNPS
jgi:hypothetical protein